jgi:hypothetical protein
VVLVMCVVLADRGRTPPSGRHNSPRPSPPPRSAKAARRAAHLIEQAEATVEEAAGVIANGYLRLDPHRSGRSRRGERHSAGSSTTRAAWRKMPSGEGRSRR